MQKRFALFSYRKENTVMVKVVTGDKDPVPIQSKDIHVGDIIVLRNGDMVPCDAVLLTSSNPDSSTYLETTNLDGETNLKVKSGAQVTQHMALLIPQIADLHAYIECENPNPDLGSFMGNMQKLSWRGQVSKKCTLSVDNFLPSGTRICKTRYLYAACVYSGQETKLSLNTKIVRAKFSKGERSLNVFFVVYFCIMITETIIFSLVAMFYGANLVREGDNDGFFRHWYFFNEDEPRKAEKVDFSSWFILFLVWLLICNYIIPISLYFSLEAQKFSTSFLFGWDLEMYDEKRDIPAKCSNSDIPEDMGLVTHIFSDKTGTLTRGDMVLQSYTLDGKEKTVDMLGEEVLNNFVLTLLICNSVDVQEDNEYVGVSPDEVALLEACRSNGVSLVESTPGGQKTVDFHGEIHRFRVLRELRFDSVRKCMSVVARVGERLVVFSKGAETAMFGASEPGGETTAGIGEAVQSFSERGNRIMVYGFKDISQEDFDAFNEELEKQEADMLTPNREDRIRDVYKFLETGFTLSGATSIQDTLQDGVGNTIVSLKEAGIVIWLLTGDKTETALAVARGARLVEPPFTLFDLVQQANPEEKLDSLLSNSDESKYSQVVVSVDGGCVDYMIECRLFRNNLYGVIKRCQAVIASRLSPLQKSHLVRLIKKTDAQSTTLAIGDGGNDVSMIEEAHIGIGIVGKEGTAAARAGDFSFAQFRFLKKAVLVHGYWNYQRLAYLLQYSFYKSVTTFSCMLFFGVVSDFSGNALYDTWFLVFYNMLFTSFPILVYAVTEQVHSKEALMKNPKLYRENAHNELLSLKRLVLWILLALYHASVVFWGAYLFCMGLSILDQTFLAHLVAGCMVTVVFITLFLHSKFWNVALLVSIFLSLLAYALITNAYTEMGSNYTRGSYKLAVSSSEYWVIFPVLIVAAMLPNYFAFVYESIRYDRTYFFCTWWYRFCSVEFLISSVP